MGGTKALKTSYRASSPNVGRYEDAVNVCRAIPGAVDVTDAGDASSRGPLDILPRVVEDDASAEYVRTGFVLTIPWDHLPDGIVGQLVVVTDDTGAETEYYVHDRQPEDGDGLLHNLTLAKV